MQSTFKFLVITTLLQVAALPMASAATYQVPTPSRLERVANFKIAEPRFGQKISRNKIVHFIRYQLPPELVGPKNAGVEMEIQNVTSRQFHLTGPAGDATCERRQPIHCSVRYKNLQIDSESVARFLKQRSSSEVELNLRLQVAEIFRNDPVGILEYSGMSPAY